MRIIVFSLVLFCTLIIGSASWTSNAGNETARKQKAVARFNNPVVLHGVTLKGEYLFVHDDAAMQRGEACTYVYQGPAEVRNKLVVSFHCSPVQRAKAERFKVRSFETSPGVIEVREFQFAGDTESHAVPTVATPYAVVTTSVTVP